MDVKGGKWSRGVKTKDAFAHEINEISIRAWHTRSTMVNLFLSEIHNFIIHRGPHCVWNGQRSQYPNGQTAFELYKPEICFLKMKNASQN